MELGEKEEKKKKANGCFEMASPSAVTVLLWGMVKISSSQTPTRCKNILAKTGSMR